MTDYGLTPLGFVPKPFAVIREERSARHRQLRGNSIDVSDGSLDGHLIAIESEREDAIWQLIQAVVSSQDPDAATDDAQDAIAALTGSRRRQARASTVTETLTGVPTTLVPIGQIIRTASTGVDFETGESVTITLLSSWAIFTAYVVGDRVTNSSRCYQCTIAGTSAGSGGPTTTALAIVDSSVTWTYLGEGTGAIDVLCSSLIEDVVVAVARDLSAPQTFVGGWQTATNLLDADPGAPKQTNESLRITREAEIADAGTGTLDATVAALRKASEVTAVTGFQNLTDAVDSLGMPPHSVQFLVTGGDDDVIARILFDNVGGGIITVGTTTVLVTDSEGTDQTYKFTRPTDVLVYADVTLTYNPKPASKGGYPVDGDDQVELALTSFADFNQVGGKDVINSSVRASILPVFVNGIQVAGVQGVIDVSGLLLYTDVIGTPAAWIASHAYVATVGSRSVVTNFGRTYICITSGTSAASVGPTGTGTNITDGTAHWYELGNTIVIGAFQQAKFDTSRIAVHSSAAGSI